MIFSQNPATVPSQSVREPTSFSPIHQPSKISFNVDCSPIPHDMAALTCAVCVGLSVGVLTAQPGPVYQPQVLVFKQGVRMSPPGVWLHQGKRLFCLHPWGHLCLLSGALSFAEPRNFMIPITVSVSKKGDDQGLKGSGPLGLTTVLPLSLHVPSKPRTTLKEISDNPKWSLSE